MTLSTIGAVFIFITFVYMGAGWGSTLVIQWFSRIGHVD